MEVLSHSLLLPPVLVHLHVQEAQHHPAETQKSQLTHTLDTHLAEMKYVVQKKCWTGHELFRDVCVTDL